MRSRSLDRELFSRALFATSFANSLALSRTFPRSLWLSLAISFSLSRSSPTTALSLSSFMAALSPFKPPPRPLPAPRRPHRRPPRPPLTARRARTPRGGNDDEDQCLVMNGERISIPEVLFRPSDTGLNQAGVAEAVVAAVQACPKVLFSLLCWPLK